jgi:hypothetical protein
MIPCSNSQPGPPPSHLFLYLLLQSQTLSPIPFLSSLQPLIPQPILQSQTRVYTLNLTAHLYQHQLLSFHTLHLHRHTIYQQFWIRDRMGVVYTSGMILTTNLRVQLIPPKGHSGRPNNGFRTPALLQEVEWRDMDDM